MFYITLLAFIGLCDAYRILIVFPIPAKSHSILGEGFVRHLLNAGHEVTYVTPILIKNPPVGLRQIDLSENNSLFTDALDIQNLMVKKVDLEDQRWVIKSMNNFWVKSLQIETMQRFMKDPNEQFDAIVVEWLYSELGAGLSTVFNAPFIWSSSMDPHTFVLSLINEHLNPAYTIHHLSRENSLTFWGRVHQLWSVVKIRYYKWSNCADENKTFRDVYGPILNQKGRALPHFDEVRYNASFMFGNSHITTGIAIPLPQNYKNIGGYHLKENIEPLSKDLQKILDGAKDGVIYFSMGSILKGSGIPEDIKRNLIDMFGKLKQTVIWKLEEVVPKLPKNLYIIPWAPQESILAHPNCVLFITHGGLLSIIESLNYGVPIIGTPFYGDQFLNVNRAVVKGFGKRIDFDARTPEILNLAIREMLQNSSYSQTAKELSKIFHDRLVYPGKELAYWTEHVINTKGARHLRSPLLNVIWYNKIYLDLVLLITSVCVAVLVILRFIVQLIGFKVIKKEKVL